MLPVSGAAQLNTWWHVQETQKCGDLPLNAAMVDSGQYSYQPLQYLHSKSQLVVKCCKKYHFTWHSNQSVELLEVLHSLLYSLADLFN